MKTVHTMKSLGLAAMLVALPLLGATGGTLSTVTGTVAVNGHAITKSAALLNGEKVVVDAAGTARLALGSSTVLASAKSVFNLETVNNTQQVRLAFGQLDVSGNLPVALNVHTVVPESSAARFNVYELKTVSYVTVSAGVVDVVTNGKKTAVRAGSAVKFDDNAAPPAPTGGGTVPLYVTISAAAGGGLLTGAIVHSQTAPNATSSATQP